MEPATFRLEGAQQTAPPCAPYTTSPSHILYYSLECKQYLYQLHSLLLTDVMFTSLKKNLSLEMSYFQIALLSYGFVFWCEGTVWCKVSSYGIFGGQMAAWD